MVQSRDMLLIAKCEDLQGILLSPDALSHQGIRTELEHVRLSRRIPANTVHVSEILNLSRRPSTAFFALNSAKFIAKVKQWSRASFILCVLARETIDMPTDEWIHANDQ